MRRFVGIKGYGCIGSPVDQYDSDILLSMKDIGTWGPALYDLIKGAGKSAEDKVTGIAFNRRFDETLGKLKAALGSWSLMISPAYAYQRDDCCVIVPLLTDKAWTPQKAEVIMASAQYAIPVLQGLFVAVLEDGRRVEIEYVDVP